jgi:methylphosphotriester-DNA--protein-cysteine methyltransferase
MKRKILGVIVLLSFFLGLYLIVMPVKSQAAQAKPGYTFVASTTGKRFHRFDCKWARRVKPSHARYFKTRDEAIRAGLKPCKRCKS